MKLSRGGVLTVLSSVGAAVLLAGGLAWWLGDRPEPASLPDPIADAGEPEEPDSFIAMRAAFEGFQGWTRHPVEGAMLPIGVQPGPTFIYANRAPPRGQARWPVGTVLVKVVEAADIAGWTMHAMVKRGVPFNPDGAVGWEFFELAYDQGDLTILWRGEGPPSGHGYAAANVDAGSDPVPLVCNDCHSADWQNDGVLTPALALH